MKNILYSADCKDALQKLIKDGVRVDLIYLDPPFNSSRTYNMIYSNNGVSAQQKAFHDMWTLTAQNQQLLFKFEEIIDSFDNISNLVKTFLKAWIAPLKEGGGEDKKTLIYLIYMTERLVLMHKILKDTGSIYFHCDPTASHYVKVIMDGIFGRENFRNEIVWYKNSGSTARTQFNKRHDVILFYTKQNHKKHYYNGKSIGDLRSQEKGSFGGYFGVDENGREYRECRKAGKIYKYYLDEPKNPDDVWSVPQIPERDKTERLGYDTQKPLALLDRVVKASCPENGIVLDPFCGCGTSIEASMKNKRNWIGIDISWDAINIMKDRIKNSPFQYAGCNDYDFRDSHPQTRAEYEKLDPFAKQDWLIKMLKGFPNPRKSGDGGVDGELTFHFGMNDKNQDKWGKLIFSVKTGEQCKPEMIRELIGTMQIKNADVGVLILDRDPSQNMELTAQNKGQLQYSYNKDLPPRFFDKVQIITAQEIIDGNKLDIPPTMQDIRIHRGEGLL